jgi:hypothetical protein
MADNIKVKPSTDGAAVNVATDEVGARHFQIAKLAFGADGTATQVSGADPLPVTLGLTDAELRATPVPVSGTVTITDGSGPVTVDGTVGITGSVAVTGPLTDAQLRAGAVSVSAASLPLPSGAATETSVAATATAIGAPADAAAGSDGATASLIALVKRLLGKIPTVGQAAMAASQPVALASDQTAIPVTPDATTATGTLNGNGQTLQISTLGRAGIAIDLRGTFTATITFQGTIDGTNWFALSATSYTAAVNASVVTQATAVGNFIAQCSGLSAVRANVTAYTSGSINVTLRAVTAAAWVYNLPQSGTAAVTVSSGTVTLGAGTAAAGQVTLGAAANATGAASRSHIVAAGTTNPTVVKASAGRVLGWSLGNTSAAWRYVKLHNQTTSPTAGSGVVQTIAIPPGGLAQVEIAAGIAFTTGIALTIVTGSADADATAVTAGDVVGDIFFA